MSSQRGNREGTIYKRADGRWEARITVDGVERKSFYGKTRQEVAQYFEAWIESVKPQIRLSTWRRYSDYVRVHLVPGLGKIPLARLTPQHIQSFYARKLSSGLTSTTVHHLHGVLHRALKDALQMGIVQRNVAEMLRAPRRSSREMMALDGEQAARLLAVVKGDSFEALYLLALTTGMRQGELLALRWHDIDLDRATLQVRVNVQEANGRFTIAEVKTTYSRRNIRLTRVAILALRAHRARQGEERQALGTAWKTALDLVFPNMHGGIMISDNLAKRSFKKHLERAGLSREIRFHDLRHTAATLLLSRGVHPKVVSEMLGHADISITLRVYAHVTPHMQEAAIYVMENLFGAAEA